MHPTLQPFLLENTAEEIPQTEASVEKIFKQTDKMSKTNLQDQTHSPKSSMQIQRGNC